MADVFVCARCGAALTAPVSPVALPVHARQTCGHQLLPALMESGTYAVDPEPSGPPWRPWNEIGPDEAAARGVFAPLHGLSFGEPGAVVVAPGDLRDTALIPDRLGGSCMGLDGRDGPNVACANCGRAVATRVDDCSYWQTAWLVPHAVRRVPVDGGPDHRPAAEWQTLIREQQGGTPPVEQSGAWDPRWGAAIGASLAHLLAASAGARVTMSAGLLADTFGHALDALLPPGPPKRRRAPSVPGHSVRRLTLDGPGLRSLDPAPDIALVPRHPRTGRVWASPGAADTVPLAADVWTYLALHDERSLVPVTGGLPDGVLRDDPLPAHPWQFLRPDPYIFLDTLARLPTVRQPWLREIHDRVRAHPYTRPF
ncbi:hypothetical protein [Streptomyces sp. NPDC001750]|uniref:hypothetical protein n=1 Tax=unclassified Streptomyces TaxID=2593676 RepID=UPI0036B18E5F